jgi:nitroreductase
MEFYEVLNKRKSIREFESKKIPRRVLIKIIKAASKAPSSGNIQPWVFYVVQNKEKRDKAANLLKLTLKKFNLNAMRPQLRRVLENFYANMGAAPCVIFIYCDLGEGKHKPSPTLLQSVVLAAGNLMNAAAAEGLGTCWVGSFRIFRKEISKLLHVPNTQELVAPIIIGYPKRGYKPLIRSKKNLKEILIWE